MSFVEILLCFSFILIFYFEVIPWNSRDRISSFHSSHLPLNSLIKVAVKVLEKSKIKDKKDVERISREIKILKQTHHPNVVQLYEIIETDKDLYLIMEFSSGGELFDIIVTNQKLKEEQACKYF